MSDIFISYAREDLPRAQLISNSLETLGYSVFWDRRISPGESFDEVIGHALMTARCVIVLWSVASVASHWVRDEATEGKNRNILVPVLIDDVQPPLGFRTLQAANLIGWQGDPQDPEFQSIVKSLERLVETSENDENIIKGVQGGASSDLDLGKKPENKVEFRLLVEFGMRILILMLPLVVFSWNTYNIYAPKSSHSFISLLGILFYIYNISFFIIISIGCVIYFFHKQGGYKIIIITSIISGCFVGIYLTYHIVHNYIVKGLITPLNNILIISGIFSFVALAIFIASFFLFRRYS
jgi:hypothetical protein